MKHKFIGLFFLLFMICALGNSFTVNADTPDQPVVVTKTVKAGKTFKVHKVLKLKKSALKQYNVTPDNTDIAAVTSKNAVTGVKKGTTSIRVSSQQSGETYAVITVKVKNSYTKAQLRLMSSIIYSEASAECYAGKKAVGIIIMNRVKSQSFPNTVEDVIYQPGQFGPAKNGALNKALSLYDNNQLSKNCIKAAKSVLNGDVNVSYKNKTINMSGYLFFSGYVNGARLQIQNHQFK